MSEIVPLEEQTIANGQVGGDIFKMCDVEPLSFAELAEFAGFVTLPQAVAPQPAFDSFIQRGDPTYARAAFASSVQPTEPTFLNADI